MINEITVAVKKQWHQFGFIKQAPDDFHFVLQSRKRIIYFLFDQKSRNSVLIVKICRKKSQNARMKRYVDLMNQLFLFLSEDVKSIISKPIELDPIYGLLCTAERVLPGEPIELVGAGREGTLELQLLQFQKTLLRFQSQADPAISRISIENNLMDMPFEPSTFSQIIKHFHTIDGLMMPTSWAFGDAHPSNILMHNGQVTGWVDWEGVQPGQWVIMDWFQFQLSMALELVKKNHTSRDLDQLLQNSTGMVLGRLNDRFSKVMIDSTKLFFDMHHLDQKFIEPLFIAFLTQYYWSPNKFETILHALKWTDNTQVAQ